MGSSARRVGEKGAAYLLQQFQGDWYRVPYLPLIHRTENRRVRPRASRCCFSIALVVESLPGIPSAQRSFRSRPGTGRCTRKGGLHAFPWQR
jgi:hypothetical protein